MILRRKILRLYDGRLNVLRRMILRFYDGWLNVSRRKILRLYRGGKGVNDDDGVNMVGHHDENWDFHMWEMCRDLLQTINGRLTERGIIHFIIIYVTEKEFPIFGANRDKIRTAFVFVPSGAGGWYAVFVFV